MTAKQLFHTSLLTTLLLFGAGSSIAEETTYNQVSFSVSAEKKVENDVLTAVLTASQSGQDTALLADTVNKDINWAIEIIRKQDAVDSRTLGYITSPVYNREGRVDGWQVQQSIELKSKDSKVLSSLLGELQQKLRVQSIAYSLSDKVRRATEETLISKALANFKNRAAQVQANMERAEYRVVQLDIQTADDMPQPMIRAVRAEGMMADTAPVAPSLDAGKQVVQVTVGARIELSEK
ncbi:MAG: hypothetical protein CSA79_00570 [Thiothrix nivea]|nr:MAG: hypothetical protein CSA79_00570 [Thiothrix nivea]